MAVLGHSALCPCGMSHPRNPGIPGIIGLRGCKSLP